MGTPALSSKFGTPSCDCWSIPFSELRILCEMHHQALETFMKHSDFPRSLFSREPVVQSNQIQLPKSA